MAKSAVDVKTLATGYIAAHDRLNAAIAGDCSLDEIFLPLHETLNLLVSVDEKRHLSKMKDLPEELRGALKGLRFARNLTHHQWGMALERKDILLQQKVVTPGRSGIYGPSVVAAWCWRPAKKLPLPTDPRYERTYKRLRPYYTCRLAGNQASSALAQIRPYVERLT